MKKRTVISAMVFISFFFFVQGVSAQRYYRQDSGTTEDNQRLNLTQEQVEMIDTLELELEKDLFLLNSQLRSNWMRLEELEAQRSQDPTEMRKILDVIYKLENEMQNKEIQHQNKIRDVLTEDQKALLDSYETPGLNIYGREAFGGGYIGRGYGRGAGGTYGYGLYNPGVGRLGLGQGAYGQVRGNYGYGRGLGRGNGLNRGYSGLGVLRPEAGYLPYIGNFRLGRGPCGAGWGRLYRWGYGRGPWR